MSYRPAHTSQFRPDFGKTQVRTLSSMALAADLHKQGHEHTVFRSAIGTTVVAPSVRFATLNLAYNGR